MRSLLILIACSGCRTILGFEDPTSWDAPAVGDDAHPSEASMGSEMGIEAPSPACPNGYSALPNSGPRGHRYKLINTLDTWATQRDTCAAEGTFLAFPDGTSSSNASLEANAISVLAGNGVWIGVNDLVTEGDYRNSLNQVASAATQSLFSGTGMGATRDCFTGAGSTINNDDCTAVQHNAVCECVP